MMDDNRRTRIPILSECIGVFDVLTIACVCLRVYYYSVARGKRRRGY